MILSCQLVCAVFITDAVNVADTAMEDAGTGETVNSNTSSSVHSVIKECNVADTQTDTSIHSCSQQIDDLVMTGQPSNTTGTVYIHGLLFAV